MTCMFFEYYVVWFAGGGVGHADVCMWAQEQN